MLNKYKGNKIFTIKQIIVHATVSKIIENKTTRAVGKSYIKNYNESEITLGQ